MLSANHEFLRIMPFFHAKHMIKDLFQQEIGETGALRTARKRRKIAANATAARHVCVTVLARIQQRSNKLPAQGLPRLAAYRPPT